MSTSRGRQLRAVLTILLLPAFFAFAGIRTEIGLLSGWEAWLACVFIILVATAGKVGGTLLDRMAPRSYPNA